MPARKVSAPNNLEWTVKRQLLSDWMRPIGLGGATRTGGRAHLGLPALVFGLLWMVVTLPVLPLVLLLRRQGLLPWTITAVTRPWGRRGPATVLNYHVRGKAKADQALDHLAARLEHGDGAPEIPGAERLV